jgi:hypothetical protein
MDTYISAAQIEGTGAELEYSCGFKPSEVTVFNLTSGDRLDYNYAMDAGSGIETTAGVPAVIATGGIELNIRGCILGTAAINGAGENLIFVCRR